MLIISINPIQIIREVFLHTADTWELQLSCLSKTIPKYFCVETDLRAVPPTHTVGIASVVKFFGVNHITLDLVMFNFILLCVIHEERDCKSALKHQWTSSVLVPEQIRAVSSAYCNSFPCLTCDGMSFM